MASGGKRPNAGRKPGVPNRVLPEIKQIIYNGIKPYLEDIPSILAGLEPKEQADVILALLPYVCSKFAPVQYDDSGNTVNNSNGQEFTISVKPVDYRVAANNLSNSDSDDDNNTE